MSNAVPIDDRGRSPFRAAVESRDIERAIDSLAPDVTFRSPVVFKPYEGREAVGLLLRAVGDVMGADLAYRWQVRDGDREVLCFASRIGDRDVEGVDLLRYGGDGLVSELVVMIRPHSAVVALRDAMAAKLEELTGAAP
jgi:hypothetical protein